MKTKLLLFIAGFFLLASSCQKDIDNVNVSPYESEQKKNLFGATQNSSSSDETGSAARWGISDNVFGILAAGADKKRSYIKNYSASAIAEMRKFGIPASIKLAQALLESDGGTSYKATKFNNHFGVKKKATKYLEIGYLVDPNDISEGEFSVYESAWFSYRSHSLFLKNRGYYDACFSCPESDYKCWAKELKQSGYSVDEDYDKKIIAVIEYYDLAKFDRVVTQRTNVAPNGFKFSMFILDNSHGNNTAGKRKTFKRKLPNGKKTVFEYKLNRQIVAKLVARCNDLGIPYKVLVPELRDVDNSERVRRANAIAKANEKQTAFLIIDHNAARFDNENSLSIASTYDFAAKQVATGMEMHHFPNSNIQPFLKALKVNVEHFLPHWANRGIKESNFQKMRNTTMAAATFELGFFDNYTEAKFLMSEEFQSKIVEAFIYTMCQFSGTTYVGNGTHS
jgi:flagellum-specific peptidoglycan hydrolase FlgJ